MTTTKKDNRFNNILTDLKSDNHKKVSTAIKQLRKHGKAEAISPIIDVLVATNHETLKEEITSFLFDLRDESAITPLLSAIDNEQYSQHKNMLISVFWQSSLDGSSHIDFFVNQAIKGDYMTCVEALTVVENFDATFDEEEIENLKYDLDEAIETEETEKLQLLISLKSTLASLNIAI